MQLSIIEAIDQELQEIPNVLREDDAYYIKDAIISNVDNPELEEVVVDMLEDYGYKPEVMEKVLVIIRKIQSIINEE